MFIHQRVEKWLRICEHILLSINQYLIFHYTRCITPKRVMSFWAHLRVIAPGKHISFRRNVAVATSRWQHCIRFDQPEIWTSDITLQKRSRYCSTNWPVVCLFNRQIKEKKGFYQYFAYGEICVNAFLQQKLQDHLWTATMFENTLLLRHQFHYVVYAHRHWIDKPCLLSKLPR